MAKLQLVTGTTSYIAQVFVQDSSSTTGAGLTGLAYNTGSLTAYYHRDTDTTATAISLVTMTVGTYTSSGFKEIDSTNMPGWYQLCPPTGALASGAKSCAIHLKGATNMAPLPLEIELTATNNQDGVHGGLTCLPNTAVTTNASLLTSGTGTDQLSVASGLINVGKINGISTGSVTTVSAVQGTTIAPTFTSALMKVDVTDWNATAVANPATAGIPEVNIKNVNNISASSVTTVAAVVGTSIAPTFTGSLIKSDVTDWNGTAVSAPATAGIPEVNEKNINNVATTAVTTVKAVQGLTTADTVVTVSGNVNGNVGGSVGSVTGAVGSVTGNVGGSVGSVTGAVGSVTGAVGSVTGAVGSIGPGGIAAASFAANAITSSVVATSQNNASADALLGRTDGVETGYTPQASLRLILSASAAKLSGAATTTVSIRDVNDTVDRIVATVDASGDRTAVVLTTT